MDEEEECTEEEVARGGPSLKVCEEVLKKFIKERHTRPWDETNFYPRKECNGFIRAWVSIIRVKKKYLGQGLIYQNRVY